MRAWPSDFHLQRAPALAALTALTALTAAACAPLPPVVATDPAPAVAAQSRNPILPGADPHLAVLDGRYWIYATTPLAAGEPERPRFYAYSSADLRRWTRTGLVFSFEGVDWIDDDGASGHTLWAPATAHKDGRYFLYYSVGPQNPTPSRIGVAVSDSPAGPFKDIGRPLVADGGNGFEAIDPMVFTDPKTGAAYLYAGGSAGATLRVWELDPSMTALKREIRVDQPPRFTEGPFMHERDGVYYLSYSHGNWDRANYSSHYATAPTPTGPWTYRGVILSSDARRKGPGHHSIIRNPSTGEWLIAYHRWERTGSEERFSGDRQIAVQRLEHGPDGSILPVRMDDAPPPASSISVR